MHNIIRNLNNNIRNLKIHTYFIQLLGGYLVGNISHNVELTSAEIANLWTQYMNDSLSICILTHSIKHAKDQDVKEILEFALSLAESHIGKIRVFFNKNNFPIPKVSQ